MYTELIKRSRVYSEYKKQFDAKSKITQNESDKDSIDTHVMDEVLRQSSRSLLLTKKQLQEMIRLLHEQNIILKGLKNPNECQPLNERLKREQKQKDQAAHIEQLKFKLQMYSKEAKNQSKKIQDLKFKIEVCEEYFKQNNADKNVGTSTNYPCEENQQPLEVSSALKNQRPQQIGSKRIQKDEHRQDRSKNQVPIIQLIKGFQHLNKHNDSLLGSFNDKDSPSPNNINSSPFCAKQLITLFKPQPEKDPYEDSSSLIQTSSFIANYQQLSAMPKFSGSIKQILNESEISIDESKDKTIEGYQPQKNLPQIEREESQLRKPLQISESQDQKEMKNQSSDQSLEELENISQQNIEEALSFATNNQIQAKNYPSTLIDHNQNKDQDQMDQNEDQQKQSQSIKSPFASKKVTFLNVLSKYNSKDVKVNS